MRRWHRPSDSWVAAAAMFCCGWGGNQFTPLLSMYRSRNGFSEVVVDALLGAYVLGLAPALLVGGGLSDRHGRKRVMTLAVLCTGLGSLAISLDRLDVLALGRLLSGVGIGLAMAVGTTWVVELGNRTGMAATTSARRASLSLTAGLGVGPGVAGVLAQFGPLPASLAYWVHLMVALPVLWLVVVRGRETVGSSVRTSPLRRNRLWPRAVADPRFRRLVLPMAPWIFCAAGVAYATVPEALHAQVSSWALLYATILTVTAMAAGFVVQPLAQRLEHPRFPRSIGVTMAVLTAGMALAAATVVLQQAWLGVLTAAVLGSALGLGIVSGLAEIGRLADPDDLARSTGLFYALSYVGFLAPMLIALSGETTAALWLLTGLAGACGLLIAARSLPGISLPPRAQAGLTTPP
jgi:MFS family permease